jgi:hypothetical protein
MHSDNDHGVLSREESNSEEFKRDFDDELLGDRDNPYTSNRYRSQSQQQKLITPQHNDEE